MAFFKGRHVPKITVVWTNARGHHAGHGNFTEIGTFNQNLLYEDFTNNSRKKDFPNGLSNRLL